VIEFFGLNEKVSNDKDVRDVLKSKRVKSYDYSKNDKHYYRLLKPLIADDSCIMCHATSKKGDILGVMDLSVSLSDSDSLILSSKTNIIMIVVATSIIGIIIFMIFFKVELFKPLAILRDLSKDLAHGDGDLTKRLNLKKRR
jgi:methyl-accepting chemotaxis protein